MERASCICRHTSHVCIRDVHRAAAREFRFACGAQFLRHFELPARIRGQGIRMGFRKSHISATREFYVFFHIQRFRAKRSPRFRGQALCMQRRHTKRAFHRFDRRTASFRLQRADRRIFLCSDRHIACHRRERARVYAARCRFCGKRSRSHVIQLRFVLAR